MKPIRSLFLIAIGMMVFTATASTAKLEQKKTPELLKEFTLQKNSVSVDKEIKNVLTKSVDTQITKREVTTSETANYPETHNAIIKDVGWRSLKGNTINKEQKEKFLSNYNTENANLKYRESIKEKESC